MWQLWVFACFFALFILVTYMILLYIARYCLYIWPILAILVILLKYCQCMSMEQTLAMYIYIHIYIYIYIYTYIYIWKTYDSWEANIQVQAIWEANIQNSGLSLPG